MTPSDIDRKRDAVAHTLEQAWTLFDEVQSYIAPGQAGSSTPPDFDAAAQRMVPEAEIESGKLLERLSLSQLYQVIADCHLCPLGDLRTKAVPGEGPTNARLMIIGEGPGAEEDASGHPFVGKAGIYLDSWLRAIGLDREHSVYIANIVKCRPPHNRDPLPDEAHSCIPYLKRQIALVKPEGILCVGKVAAHFLLNRDDALRSMRGSIHRFEGIPVVVTYHPAAVLRNLELRAPVWEDLRRVASLLGLPVASGRR